MVRGKASWIGGNKSKVERIERVEDMSNHAANNKGDAEGLAFPPSITVYMEKERLERLRMRDPLAEKRVPLLSSPERRELRELQESPLLSNRKYFVPALHSMGESLSPKKRKL